MNGALGIPRGFVAMFFAPDDTLDVDADAVLAVDDEDAGADMTQM